MPVSLKRFLASRERIRRLHEWRHARPCLSTDTCVSDPEATRYYNESQATSLTFMQNTNPMYQFALSSSHTCRTGGNGGTEQDVKPSKRSCTNSLKVTFSGIVMPIPHVENYSKDFDKHLVFRVLSLNGTAKLSVWFISAYSHPPFT